MQTVLREATEREQGQGSVGSRGPVMVGEGRLFDGAMGDGGVTAGRSEEGPARGA